jgi:Uma2 family endonuclease
MTIAQKQRKWTVAEFLAWHEHQEERYELVAGVPVLKRAPVPVMLPGATAPTMMTGASLRHNKVSANLSRLIGNQLRSGPCNVFVNDAAVETAVDQIRYPDLVVDCSTRVDQGYLLQQPKLVSEILSPSTKTFDLTGKITEYWQIVSISDVLIVDPDRLRVQLHTRGVNGAPTVRIFSDGDDVVDIPEIGVTLALSDIFEGLAPVTDQ